MVFWLIALLNKSPVETWGILNFLTINSLYVPFPEAGGPIKIIFFSDIFFSYNSLSTKPLPTKIPLIWLLTSSETPTTIIKPVQPQDKLAGTALVNDNITGNKAIKSNEMEPTKVILVKTFEIYLAVTSPV